MTENKDLQFIKNTIRQHRLLEEAVKRSNKKLKRKIIK